MRQPKELLWSTGEVLALLLLPSRVEAGSLFLEHARITAERQRMIILAAVLVAMVITFVLVLVRASSRRFERIQLGASALLTCVSAVWVAYEAEFFLSPYPRELGGSSVFFCIAVMFLVLSFSLSLSLLRALKRRRE